MPSHPIVHKSITLPHGQLSYYQAGQGEPLVLLPATMSRAESTFPLIEFLAQRFTVYFIELPGHGASDALHPYSALAVAKVLESFMDRAGIERVVLMGFSFGGVLTLSVLQVLSARIDRVILISPLVDSKTILVPLWARWLLLGFVSAVQPRLLRRVLFWHIHTPSGARFWSWFVSRVGNVEHPQFVEARLGTLDQDTFDTLRIQMVEMMHTAPPKAPLPQRCFFAMSTRDPMLDFRRTREVVNGVFSAVSELQLDFPYHQPPETFSFDYLSQHYGRSLRSF